jgi:hypothetical protein
MFSLAFIVFSTFVGGDRLEFAGQVSFDSQGNVIVIGSTMSTTFPMISGTPKSVDAYVVKLSPDGSRVLWGTFLGGSGLEDTLSLALDAGDNIYLCGRTDSRDFPVTASAPQKEFGGGGFDGYVVKFNAGGELLFATYMGGSGSDAPDGIAVDRSGNIVIGGDTSSADYPLVRPYQSENRGGTDLFVTRFAPDGSVAFSTYIGSTASDAGHAITFDANGNAWFTGAARTGDFPILNAVQNSYGGGNGDTVLVAFAPDGTLVTSTYLGGSGFDGGDGVAIAPDGAIWVAGRTESNDFPLRTVSASDLAGGFDTFLAKFDPQARTLLLSTFIGGGSADFPLDLTITPAGQPIVCGETSSLDFPTKDANQSVNGGSFDAYVAMFDANAAAIVFSTYFGGDGYENCSSLSRRGNRIAITGTSGSPGLALVHPLRSTWSGGEGYAAVLELETPESFPKRRAVKR